MTQQATQPQKLYNTWNVVAPYLKNTPTVWEANTPEEAIQSVEKFAAQHGYSLTHEVMTDQINFWFKRLRGKEQGTRRTFLRLMAA